MHGQVIAGIRAHAAAKVLVQGISWAGTIVVLRHLDSEALGVFAVASAVLGYGLLIFEGSLLEALVQRAPADVREQRGVHALLAVAALVPAALIAGLAWPLSRWVAEPRAAGVIATMAGALLITALGLLPQASLMRAMRFDRLAFIASVQAIVATATTVTLAFLDAGAWSLAVGLLAGLAIRTAMLNIAVPHRVWQMGRVRDAWAYARVGGVLILDGFLWRLYTSIDTFLLGRWTGTATLGFYSFGQHVANMPLEKISTIVNDVSLPAYAELERNRMGAASLLLETIRAHAVIGFPIFWGFACVAPFAVPLIFGDKWLPAVLPLVAFASVAPIRLMGSVETPAMTGIGRPEVLLQTKAVIVPCMTLALGAGCWLDGVRGASLAWALVFPLCYAFAFRYVLRAARVAYRDLFRIVRGPISAAATMVAAVQMLRATLDLGRLTMLSVMVVVGAVAYVLFLRVTDREAFSLTVDRLRRVLSIRPQVDP